MGTKLIYFVRHGETKLNAADVRQGSEGGLTEKGRAQAYATAKRFPSGKGKPKIIISSPFERTRETTDILNEKLKLPVEYCDLLVERRNPTEIIGHSMTEPKTKEIVDLIDGSFHDDNYRYSDEENFADLKNRVNELLYYIVARKEKRIIMVSHGIFLKMVAAYIIYGNKLSAKDYNTLSYYNPLNNAGISIVSYTTHWFRPNEWKLIVWNDLM